MNSALSGARKSLLLTSPFFSALLLQVKMEENTSLDSIAATSSSTIYINPDRLGDLSKKQIKFVLIHELMHILLLHTTRCGGRDLQLWNIACDYVVNLQIQNYAEANRDVIELVPDILLDKRFAGMTAEKVYDLLLSDGNQKGGSKESPKSKKPPSSNQQGNSSDGDQENNNDESDGGQKNGPSKKPSFDQIITSEMSGDDEKLAEAKIQQMATRAAIAARQVGTEEGIASQFLDNELPPKLDWKELLRQFISQKVKSDYSWSRGNRRFISTGLYLPSLHTDGCGEFAVCVDTSGSISGPELDAFAAEINGIFEDANPAKIYVIYCDNKVQRVDTFERGDTLTLEAVGGGGTSFVPPFTWLSKRNIKIDALIYLTDGYGKYPDAQDFPVLWVINNRDQEPPFGEHIILDLY